MLLLGIDIGTSSLKVSVVDAATQKAVASAQYPDEESPIKALHPGWAEQSPSMWWEQFQKALERCQAKGGYNPQDIAAIGIVPERTFQIEPPDKRNVEIVAEDRNIDLSEGRPDVIRFRID